jgi:hypothetical protein
MKNQLENYRETCYNYKRSINLGERDFMGLHTRKFVSCRREAEYLFEKAEHLDLRYRGGFETYDKVKYAWRKAALAYDRAYHLFSEYHPLTLWYCILLSTM